MSNDPVRILHCPHEMTRAGTQTLIIGVYRNIDRSRVQFDFLLHTDQLGDFDEEILSLGGRIFRVPEPRSIGPWRYGQAVNAVLRKAGGFLGVHAYLYLFSGYLLWLARRAGVRLRLSHSQTVLSTNGDSLRSLTYGWLMRRLIRRYATHLLAPSRRAAESLFGEGCIRDSRFCLIPNAIDLECYRTLPDRYISRASLGLPTEEPLVGHVGRFVPAKNHLFLIEVFANLSRYEPRAHLVMVGDGPLCSEISALIRAKGLGNRSHFLGVRADVPQIMSALDLLVLPSLREGTPLVVIEAQAAGVACLASDVVPPEADVGLGLLHKMGLSAGTDVWAEKALELLRYDRPPWSAREQALRTSGYDVREVARRLQEIYTGEKA